MQERRKKKNKLPTLLIFIILIFIILASSVILIPVYRNYKMKQSKLNKVLEENNILQNKVAKLNAEVAKLKSNPKAIEKVAREKFGLAKEGESVLKYTPKDELEEKGIE